MSKRKPSKPKLSEIEARAQRALHNYDHFTNDADRSLGIDVPVLMAAIRSVADMHRESRITGRCVMDEDFWPCSTMATLAAHLDLS